jgi:hypothetical protein
VGLRLGVHKGDYNGGWAEWSEEMQGYMEQDVVVLKLFQWLMAQKPAAEAPASSTSSRLSYGGRKGAASASTSR